MKFYEYYDEKYLRPMEKYESFLDNWENIIINENNEELVSLKNVSDRIIIKPEYYLQGIEGAINDCLIRKTIKDKLINITNKLPKGYKLLVWDGYRSFEVQENLYKKYYELVKESTHLEGEELENKVRKFVSKPSKDKLKPAPHSTGAAIDLTIVDENNKEINLGTFFDDFEKKSYTRFFEEKYENGEILSDEEMEILYNRRVIFYLFDEEDFVNYPYEIWHKSYGDQMYARLKNKKEAIYGSK